MKNVKTEHAFLDAAEALFAEHGFEGTRVRAIAEAANANLGALHYYWGSKEALFAAVWERRMAGLVTQRKKILEELTALPDKEIKTETILTTWIEAALGANLSEHQPSEAFQRLFGRAITDPSPEVRRIVSDYLDESSKMLVRLLKRACPELSDTEIFWRLHGLLGSVLYAHIGRIRLDRIASELKPEKDLRVGAGELAKFVIAGFNAPGERGV
ncbi:MAG TPA: TetR/AcrR family transcriptional regulator [Sphingomonadaceae bacterium]|nr:TetR/AcrR family transcriptional regulator [Sphingomonadaceae bacterium]